VSAWRRSDILPDGQLGRALRHDDPYAVVCRLGPGWLIYTQEHGDQSASDLAVLLAVRGLPLPSAADLLWVQA
jgi:hypothetical protein